MARMLKLLAALGAATVLMTGCNRMTPEERLEKMAEALQQNDVLGAELEARKLIEKHPDDPLATTARLQLAQIYARDGRLDEAAAEYQAVLDEMPPGSMDAINIMSRYNQVLKQQRRFSEAFALVERYEKEFTTSPEVLLNMKVARADLKIATGETSEARNLLRDAMGMTTNPLAQMQFRDLYVQTLVREENTTGVIEFLEEQIAASSSEEDRRQLVFQLAVAHSQLGDYEQTRRALEKATAMTEGALKGELDQRARTQQLFDLAQVFEATGNLKESEQLLRRLYETTPDPSFGPMVVPALFQNLVRQGKKDDALAFIRKASERYKDPQLVEQVNQVEAAMKTGRFDQKDTAPLVLQFADAPPLLPASLAAPSADGTTETVSADVATTASPDQPVPAAIPAGEVAETTPSVPVEAPADADAGTTLSLSDETPAPSPADAATTSPGA